MVSIAGHSITRGGPIGTYSGGPAYTVTYALQSADSAYDEAFIPYSVTAADNAGNANNTYASQTSVIKFYESLPTVPTVTIASTTNPHLTWAKQGDTVRLSFTTLRDLNAAATVTMAGPPQNSVTPSPASLTAHSYTADYMMAVGDAEGTVPFTISIVDAAGNTIAAPVTTITSGSNVIYDRRSPSATRRTSTSSTSPLQTRALSPSPFPAPRWRLLPPRTITQSRAREGEHR